MAAIYQWFSAGIKGICGWTSALLTGTLTPVHPMQMQVNITHWLSTTTPDTDGWVFNNTKSISCTWGFCRQNPPVTIPEAPIFWFYDTDAGNGHVNQHICLNVYMDTSGHMQVRAYNSSGILILSVSITNNGGSFCTTTEQLFSFVANLFDPTKREVWINGTDRTEDPNYVTWNVYTDDFIQLASVTPDDMNIYLFGRDRGLGTDTWGEDIAGYAAGIDGVGHLTFHDECALISAGIWDENGNIKDPQGDYSGWFKTQPKFGWTTSIFNYPSGQYKWSADQHIDYSEATGIYAAYDNSTGGVDQQEACSFNLGVGEG